MNTQSSASRESNKSPTAHVLAFVPSGPGLDVVDTPGLGWRNGPPPSMRSDDDDQTKYQKSIERRRTSDSECWLTVLVIWDGIAVRSADDVQRRVAWIGIDAAVYSDLGDRDTTVRQVNRLLADQILASQKALLLARPTVL